MSATALLHERTRELTARYERHAYLVYNLALRITCAEAPAALAAERAFLTAADDAALVGAAARAALEEAPGQPACDGAGDEQATALLRATAALAPVQRAALALSDLAEADLDDIAAALALAPGLVEGILERARADGPSDEARAGWLWARPPDELWERTYHRFHEETERDLSEPAVVMPPEPPRAKRRRRRWPLVLALLAAAVAGALYGTGIGLGGGGGGTPSHPRGDQAAAASAPAAAVPAPPPPAGGQETTPVVAPNPKVGAAVKPAKPLTPKELDALRLRELAQVKRYAQQQADHSLPAQQRQEAAREVARFQRVAQKRLEAAAKREAKLRSELARERAARRREAAARRAAEREAAAKAKAQATQPKPAPKPAAKPAPPPAQTTPQQGDDTSCLYNANDGTYICPDG